MTDSRTTRTSGKVRFDKETRQWISEHAKFGLNHHTVEICEKCGLAYKPSLGHKCKGG